MATELVELARQLAAHPKWEWRSGMSDGTGYRYLVHSKRGVWITPPVELPDLADFATCGCLLEMLAAELPDPNEVALEGRPGCSWLVSILEFKPEESVCERVHCGTTPGEALARALLAVWGRE